MSRNRLQEQSFVPEGSSDRVAARMRSIDKSVAFYGLKEQPFGVTPDIRFLYLSPSHREALASLFFAIEARRGFSALVATPGMGKTTLLFKLLNDIKDHARSAFVFQPDCSPPEFMRALLDDLGISHGNEGMSSLQRLLNDALVNELRAGKRFVLVVDEAQDLDDSMLERIRLLSNFETPTAKLIHIILAGQPQLAERLERPELVQLRQRVSTISRLSPFTSIETVDYILHRLRVAGCRDDQLFTSRALQFVSNASDGIPRNINSLCFLSLSLGFAKQQKRIDVDTVQEAAEDALPVTPSPKPDRRETIPTPTRRLAAEEFEDEPFHFSSIRAERRSRGLGALAIVLLIVPLAAIFLLSDQQLESDAANLITGPALQLDSSTSSKIPALRPPIAPAIEEVALTSKSNNTETQNPQSNVTSNEEPEESARKFTSPSQDKPPIQAGIIHGPQRIRADRRQTLFELALIHYGKSNWGIVEQICAANPGLRCPYGVIQPGQQIVLPDLSPKYPLLSADGHASSNYRSQE